MSELSPKRGPWFNFNSGLMTLGVVLIGLALKEIYAVRTIVNDIVAVQPFRNDAATRMEKKQDDFSHELGQLRDEIQKIQLKMASGWPETPRARSPKDQ